MNTLKVKIHAWDGQSNSLVVSFWCDGAKKQVGEYQKLAYQPTMFDNTDPQYVLKRIAQSGVSVMETELNREAFEEQTAVVSSFEALVGQELEFDVDTLFTPT
jgi:hypothetical protein